MDDYDCVQIIDDRLLSLPLDSKWFDNILDRSLQHWSENGSKAIWLQIRSPTHLHLVPFIASHGFYPHHCQPHYIMFTKWMDPSKVNQLPAPPQHAIGVGAVVINSKRQLLMVQESTGPAAKYKIWKLPGGLVDSNELIAEAVRRELKEETGVNARFKAWGCTIEMMQKYRGSKDGDNGKNIDPFYVDYPARGSKTRDIYCMCLCEVIGDEKDIKLNRQKSEIADLRWVDLHEVFKMPLWKVGADGVSSGVWSSGLKSCVEIHDGKRKGFNHEVSAWAFNKGKASLYRSRL